MMSGDEIVSNVCTTSLKRKEIPKVILPRRYKFIYIYIINIL